jgi:molybdate transport system substrate-binding protein
VVLIGACLPVLAADIKILSIGTVSSVLRDLIPGFERGSGNKVHITFGGPGAVLDRLNKGELADVIIVPEVLWDQSEKTGRMISSTRTLLPTTPYAVGMPPGYTASETICVSYFQHLLENAKSVGLVDRSPSTALLAQNLARLGMSWQLEAKAKTYPNGSAIAEALVHEEVDMGISTLSELVSIPEVVIMGPVPADILPLKATSIAAVGTGVSSPKAAAAFIKFLVSPIAIAAFKAKGFEVN